MSQSAIRGTYSDWKLIKTRGVVQIIIEVPLSDADAAYEVLGGMPNLANERWFAIAPLKDQEVGPAHPPASNPGQEIPRPDRAKRSWRELHPAQQAGMRCNEPLFQAFLEQEKRNAWTDGASILGGDTNRYEQAVRCVRALCSVSSRADLNKDPDAADIWRRLDDQYEAWKLT